MSKGEEFREILKEFSKSIEEDMCSVQAAHLLVDLLNRFSLQMDKMERKLDLFEKHVKIGDNGSITITGDAKVSFSH